MKKLLGIIAAMVFLTFVSSFVLFAEGSKEKEADVAAIKEVLNQYAPACNAMDVDRYISLWDDNGIQMPPGAPENIGKEKIREGTKIGFEMFNWDMSIDELMEIEVDGDLGFTRCLYTVTLTPKAGGDAIYVDGKALTILKRQADGSWKVYRDCFNSNVPPPQ